MDVVCCGPIFYSLKGFGFDKVGGVQIPNTNCHPKVPSSASTRGDPPSIPKYPRVEYNSDMNSLICP